MSLTRYTNILLPNKSATLSPVSNYIFTSNYATIVKGSKPKKVKKFKNIGAVPLQTAIQVLRAEAIGKEERSTVDIMVRYDRRKFNRELLGSVNLPKPMAQDVKVLVFAEGKDAELAKQLGADIVGGQDLIDEVKEGKVDFNKCITTPAMLPHVVKIARILGPRGLMPTVKKGNVTTDLGPAIQTAKGLFDFKSDNTGMVRAGVARLTFSDEDIKNALLYAVYDIGAPVVKRGFLQQVCLKTTQGPGILVEDVIGNTVNSHKAANPANA